MKNLFDTLYNSIMESMTVGSVGLGAVGEPSPTQFSADTYAPGDSRNLFGGVDSKGKKKKKKIKMQRRPRNF